MPYFKTYAIRHACSVSLVVLAAFLLDHYLSFSKEGWLLLSAFLASQTTRGTPLRQILIYAFITMVSVIAATSLVLLGHEKITYAVLVFMFIANAYFIYLNRGSQPHYYCAFICIFILLTAAGVGGTEQDWLPNRMLDVVIGAVLALLGSRLIFPVRPLQEFKQSALCTLQAILPRNDKIPTPTRMMINILHSEAEKQLDWVYEIGFNPGLRSGFRFFSIQLDRMIEIGFSTAYFFSLQEKSAEHSALHLAMQTAMEKNRELMQQLMAYFADKATKDQHSHSDFTSDITQLEAALQQVVPLHLELLDLSPQYVTLTALVYDIKDLRKVLLQLLMALPE